MSFFPSTPPLGFRKPHVVIRDDYPDVFSRWYCKSCGFTSDEEEHGHTEDECLVRQVMSS